MNFFKTLFVVFLFFAEIFPQDSLYFADNISSIDEKSDVIPLSLVMQKYPQHEYDPLQTEINYTMLAGMGAATLATGIVIHMYQRDAWWKEQRTSFHFQNDPTYALNIDKVGHFFGGAFIAHLFSGALEASNMQSEPAAIWGSALAVGFQMYVEIEDGFGPQWGFSPGDAVADVLGSGYTLSQYYFPFLKNFLIKFSYYPSEEMRNGVHPGNFIDDYEGQKFWMGMRVKNLIPASVSKVWPEWLNLAVGTGVKNLDGSGGGSREFYLGLDFDFESLPLYGPVWQFVKNTFNYFHLPMPGIRFTNNSTEFVFFLY